MKIKEKKITNEKRKNKIVRVHHLELWQRSDREAIFVSCYDKFLSDYCEWIQLRY